MSRRNTLPHAQPIHDSDLYACKYGTSSCIRHECIVNSQFKFVWSTKEFEH